MAIGHVVRGYRGQMRRWERTSKNIYMYVLDGNFFIYFVRIFITMRGDSMAVEFQRGSFG